MKFLIYIKNKITEHTIREWYVFSESLSHSDILSSYVEDMMSTVLLCDNSMSFKGDNVYKYLINHDVCFCIVSIPSPFPLFYVK